MRTRQVAYGLLRLGEPPHLMSVRSRAELCFDGSPTDRFVDQPVSFCSLVQAERCELGAPFDHGANSFAGLVDLTGCHGGTLLLGGEL